jgi:hypothetical protein
LNDTMHLLCSCYVGSYKTLLKSNISSSSYSFVVVYGRVDNILSEYDSSNCLDLQVIWTSQTSACCRYLLHHHRFLCHVMWQRNSTFLSHWNLILTHSHSYAFLLFL